MRTALRYIFKAAVIYFVISLLAGNPQILKHLKAAFDNVIVGTTSTLGG